MSNQTKLCCYILFNSGTLVCVVHAYVDSEISPLKDSLKNIFFYWKGFTAIFIFVSLDTVAKLKLKLQM